MAEGAQDSIAAAGAKRPTTGAALFDYWVDVEGATNVTETYLEATAAAEVSKTAANAKEDIEQEMGGTLAPKTRGLPRTLGRHAR